jgi:hypothetical protein
MKSRLSPRKAAGHVSEQLARIVDDAENQVEGKGPYFGYVVPDAVGTAKVTVPREGEA